MKFKKTICIVAAAAIVLSGFAVRGTDAEEVVVKLDGEKIECPVPARIENGSTMVPMRVIFEAFDMNVEWNNDEKSVTATDGENVIKLTVGSDVMLYNGEEIKLPVAPFISENTTLVPVRAISETLDATVEWDGEKKQVKITSAEFLENMDKWKENEGTIDLATLVVTGEGIEVKGNVVYITKGGDFSVTGKNENAMIHVNAKEKVKLRLSGMEIKNPTGPAIFFENSYESMITISKGTENFVSDGIEYSVDAKAAIFSNDDIEIKGEGVLNVVSEAHHGIASDDDIKIEEGTIVIEAKGKDGIHANNTIKIKGGSITVTAFGDGIQAEEDVLIEDGEINVTTTGVVQPSQNNFGGGFGGGMPGGGRGNRRENQNAENTQNTAPMERFEPEEGESMPENWQRPEGMARPENWQRPEGMTPPEGGMMPPEGVTPPEGGMMPPEGMTPPEGEMMPPEGMTPPEMTTQTEATDETASTKGIKAETDITIEGGKIVVNSSDHAIHSAGTLNIKGGEMTLNSKSGKGVSAHGDVVIDDGKIVVEKASEGLESKANFTINGGNIAVMASDDGINAGGTGGRDVVNRQNSDAETGHDLVINGGVIFVNASGDGLDANGRLIVTGGDIVVEGPTNNGNGSLDSGGVIKVDGGTLLALGASGMAETPDENSKQLSFRLVTEENIASGSVITIKDSKGEVIYSYTTVKTGNSVIFSSDKLFKGETYEVAVGEKKYEITLDKTVTTVGNGGFGGGFGGRW